MFLPVVSRFDITLLDAYRILGHSHWARLMGAAFLITIINYREISQTEWK